MSLRYTFRLALVILFSTFVSFSFAIQEDESQPGKSIEEEVKEQIDSGAIASLAVEQIMRKAITEDSTVVDPETKSIIAFDLPLAESLMLEIVTTGSVVSSIKALMEIESSKAIQIVTLGLQLYPKFSDQVLKGALLADVLTKEDLYVVALQTGVDPSNLLQETASGDNPIGILIPLGAGIGAAGTGGGETTASSN